MYTIYMYTCADSLLFLLTRLEEMWEGCQIYFDVQVQGLTM